MITLIIAIFIEYLINTRKDCSLFPVPMRTLQWRYFIIYFIISVFQGGSWSLEGASTWPSQLKIQAVTILIEWVTCSRHCIRCWAHSIFWNPHTTTEKRDTTVTPILWAGKQGPSKIKQISQSHTVSVMDWMFVSSLDSCVEILSSQCNVSKRGSRSGVMKSWG